MILHTSRYMRWITLLNKNVLSSMCLSSIQCWCDSVTYQCNSYCHSYSYETRITHFLEDKRPLNSKCGKSRAHRDFLVAQWSFHESFRNFGSPISVVWVLTDPWSVIWAPLVHNTILKNMSYLEVFFVVVCLKQYKILYSQLKWKACINFNKWGDNFFLFFSKLYLTLKDYNVE